jgi:hypothetical protein
MNRGDQPRTLRGGGNSIQGESLAPIKVPTDELGVDDRAWCPERSSKLRRRV